MSSTLNNRLKLGESKLTLETRWGYIITKTEQGNFGFVCVLSIKVRYLTTQLNPIYIFQFNLDGVFQVSER